MSQGKKMHSSYLPPVSDIQYDIANIAVAMSRIIRYLNILALLASYLVLSSPFRSKPNVFISPDQLHPTPK